MLEERLADLETEELSAFAEQHNVWGLRYIDDLVLRDRDTSETRDGIFDQRLYALQDANWNVVAIVEPDGDVAERYSYTAYGKAEFREPTTFAQKSPNASSFGWTVLYTGCNLDPETGLQINRNRYLHLDLGRFIVPDPAYSDPNLYRYCKNVPVLDVDPTGLAVPGTKLFDTVTPRRTTEAWEAVMQSADYGGQTVSKRVPSVTGAPRPGDPSCCDFKIERYDYGVNTDLPAVGVVVGAVWWDRWGKGRWTGETMTADMFAIATLHEGFHRKDNIAVWEKYKALLSATGTCSYYWTWAIPLGVPMPPYVVEVGVTQTVASCNKHAETLEASLIRHLREYQHAVAYPMDYGPNRVNLHSTADETRAAHNESLAVLAALQMRDWTCKET